MIRFNPEKIYEFRIKRDLTQMELSEIIDVTSVTICRWENGLRIPNANHLGLLSEALGVSIEDFFIKED